VLDPAGAAVEIGTDAVVVVERGTDAAIDVEIGTDAVADVERGTGAVIDVETVTVVEIGTDAVVDVAAGIEVVADDVMNVETDVVSCADVDASDAEFGTGAILVIAGLVVARLLARLRRLSSYIL
jgi:hypothetical protein